MQKSIAFPYTNNEQSEYEMKETISLKLYSENYKISLKGIDPNNH